MFKDVPILKRNGASARYCKGAFTLVELMVTMALFTMVILVIVYSHIFGLKMYGIVHAKLSASNDARRTVSRLVDEVRSSGEVRVGNWDGSAFAEIPVNTLQRGNALRVFMDATNTSDYIQYSHNAQTDELSRYETGEDEGKIIAHSVTNELIFASEDFAGNTLSNNFNSRVVAVTMQFSKSIGGSGDLRDYYQLRTKITRRAIE